MTAAERDEIEETGESPVFSYRLQPLDQRDLATIIELDPDVVSRTDATRAALRDYARKLRRRAGAA